MQRLWLIFSQSVTVILAALFVVNTLKPQWLEVRQRTFAVANGTASGTSVQQQTAGATGSLRLAARTAAPSVVSINTSQARSAKDNMAEQPWLRHFFGQAPEDFSPKEGLGSGVIVSATGYILTNNHVVDGAEGIEVVLNDGRAFKGTVIGTDPETDLAVLKIDAENLPVIAFANINTLEVGDAVMAIGNPFGVGQTVTSGIVSALGRNQLGINTFENFIQTDAAINPGNSGGALVDGFGQLLGINTAIYSRSGGNLGIGFAIPVSTVRMVMDSIISEGKVTRGWMGLEPKEYTNELAQAYGLPLNAAPNNKGVVIAGVLQNGPAAHAGLRPGDAIETVADQRVNSVPQLLAAVAALKPGAITHVTVRRKTERLRIAVTPVTRPRPKNHR
jgi:Do/DeqQ family serine protease